MELTAVSISVFGNVQGVYFRQSTKAKADELGLHGVVRNQADGSVYVEVEGEAEKVDLFIQWCAKGPVLARVTRLVTGKIALKNRTGFVIER